MPSPDLILYGGKITLDRNSRVAQVIHGAVGSRRCGRRRGDALQKRPLPRPNSSTSRALRCCRVLRRAARLVSSRKIRLAHVRIANQFAPAPIERQRAGFQQVGVIAHVQCGRRILLNHKDGRAGRANVGDDIEGALDNVGGETERRLIEQDELGRIGNGRDIRARPMASICCSPPDSVPAACRRSARRGN